ncbi:hypothetical protein [Streptomyces phaeochromogenes]
MRTWLRNPSLWTWLHNPGLRTRHTYLIARRSSTSLGRTTTYVRLLCCVIVAITGFSAVGNTSTAWWLTLIVLPFLGSALAIIHAREDIIKVMMYSRLWPLRMLGRNLQSTGWVAQFNLPGILEGVGPLLVAWMVGAPSGPFAEHPAQQIIAAAAVLLYGWLGTLHWAIDSTLYHYLPGLAWPVWFTRLARGVAPAGFAVLYGWLLSRDTTADTVTIPFLAAAFLLLYPSVLVYEQFLASAEIERIPAVMAQRLKDATIVHSNISNPLHFVLMAIRNRSTDDAEALLIYLRGELERCLGELDHGHSPAAFDEVVKGVQNSLLPQDRQRIVLGDRATMGRLTSTDASVARCVLADLCCNALKETREGSDPIALITARLAERRITIQVADDGPGSGEDWEPGTSLVRLRGFLRELEGDLTWQDNEPTGMVFTACWKLDPPEEAHP